MINIKFTSKIEELLYIPELHPQPSKNYIPNWYKKTPVDDKNKNKNNYFKSIPHIRTVKTCPSFHSIFDEGLVLLAPCDIFIYLSDDNENYEWRTANKDILNIEYHHYEQFLKYYDNKLIRAVFKINSPWLFSTPKGYSLRQIPYLYKEDNDWTVPYGVVKTDIHNEVNVQLLYTSKNNEIFIKKGEPLCYLIPYKREKIITSIIKNKKARNKFLHNYKVNALNYVGTTFRSQYHKLKD